MKKLWAVGIAAVGVFLAVGWGLALAQTVQASQTVLNKNVYLPMTRKAGGGAIVINHLTTDLSKIPAEWIAQAKTLSIHYAHTSHGGQILEGLTWLEEQNPLYNVDIHESGTVVRPDDTAALRIYDGNDYAGNTYITPDMYWESETGKTRTRAVAQTGWFQYSTWTWCGQMSYYSEEQVQTYIDTLAGFQNSFPGMRYFFFTGHSDGSGPDGTLFRNNDMLRTYVQQNNQILFDFADIDNYDPDGNFYANDGDGNCTWCEDWCSTHPGQCTSLPSYCAHTHPLQCKLKSAGFWWLMARLAGWDGTPVQ